MNMKKRGLGKGLSDLGLGALLGDLKTPATPISITEETVLQTDAPNVDGQLKKLPINALKPGKYQPRKVMDPDGLAELADSIRAQGVIQPIVVRSIENNQFEIIAGERRFRAAQLAGLDYVPAIIRDINDQTAMVFALIENIQRRDLNAVEEAVALNRMISEFQMTHEAVAEAVGKSRTAVTNLLRLLKLHPSVRTLLESGQLEMGHARALLTLDEEKQTQAANIIVSRHLSVRETEDMIRKSMQLVSAPEKSSSKVTLYSIQDRLTQQLNSKVSVTQNAKGRGKMIIHFRNQKELESVLSRIV